jgi:hypothetical protein
MLDRVVAGLCGVGKRGSEEEPGEEIHPTKGESLSTSTVIAEGVAVNINSCKQDKTGDGATTAEDGQTLTVGTTS